MKAATALSSPSLAAFAAFLPALGGGWLNWDDEVNFVHNPHFRGLGPAQLEWMLTTTQLAVYAPLAWITLGFNYLVGGLDPWGYHLGNMLIHAGSAVLFFLIARRLLAAAVGAPPATAAPGILPGAAVAALVFAVHPLRVESVAWVTERRDVLSALFYLAAVLAYLRGVERPGPLRGGWRLAALGAFAAALAAKGLAVTLPASLLVLDVYPLRRHRALGWRALLVEKVPFAALSLLGAIAALWAVAQGARWTPYAEQGPLARVAMTAYSLWFYPSRFAWPVGLSPYYEMPEQVRLADGRFLVPALVVALATAALSAARRRWPAGLAAWIHSAIAIAPVSGALHAGQQLAHDRFGYLSGLGFALLAGGAMTWLVRVWSAARVGTRSSPRQRRTALAVLGSASAWEQSKVWRVPKRSAPRGRRSALRTVPDNLGNVLWTQRLLEAGWRATGLRPGRRAHATSGWRWPRSKPREGSTFRAGSQADFVALRQAGNSTRTSAAGQGAPSRARSRSGRARRPRARRARRASARRGHPPARAAGAAPAAPPVTRWRRLRETARAARRGGIAALSPALGAGFLNWDDRGDFLSNPYYRRLGWRSRWMFTTTCSRPRSRGSRGASTTSSGASTRGIT